MFNDPSVRCGSAHRRPRGRAFGTGAANAAALLALCAAPSAAFAGGGAALPMLVQFLAPIDPGTGDELGRSVAYREPFLVAGAWSASQDGPALHGRATIWRWHPSGWITEATVTASDMAEGDRFGGAVALSRSSQLLFQRSAAAIGAHAADVGAHPDAGAVYIFRRNLDGSWTEEAKLSASDPQDDAQFGRAVAMDGDLVAIGAPQRNNFRGAVYLFRMSLGKGGAPVWNEEAILTPTGVFAGDAFGTSVAVVGDTVIAGAPGDDMGTSLNQGAVFVFQRVGDSWLQSATARDPNGQQLDEFGRSVSLDPSVAQFVVGNSPTLTSGLATAHVFKKSGSLWVYEESLAPPQPEVGDLFASTLSIREGKIAIGAPGRTVGGGALRGAVFVFDQSPLGWLFEEMLVDAAGANGDSFGASVGIAGEGVAIGAKGVDQDSISNVGAVHVGWITDCNENGQFDLCHPVDADLNGDGFVDGDDLGSLLGLWGEVEPFSAADMNGDGFVDGNDLGVLLGAWTG